MKNFEQELWNYVSQDVLFCFSTFLTPSDRKKCEQVCKNWRDCFRNGNFWYQWSRNHPKISKEFYLYSPCQSIPMGFLCWKYFYFALYHSPFFRFSNTPKTPNSVITASNEFYSAGGIFSSTRNQTWCFGDWSIDHTCESFWEVTLIEGDSFKISLNDWIPIEPKWIYFKPRFDGFYFYEKSKSNFAGVDGIPVSNLKNQLIGIKCNFESIACYIDKVKIAEKIIGHNDNEIMECYDELYPVFEIKSNTKIKLSNPSWFPLE